MTSTPATGAPAAAASAGSRLLTRLRRLPAAGYDAWRRSLQFRVGATTVAVTGVVVLLVGVFLVNQLASGVLQAKRTAAINQARLGIPVARQTVQDVDACQPAYSNDAISKLRDQLTSSESSAGLFQLVTIAPCLASAPDESGVSIGLRNAVAGGNLAVQYAPVPEAADSPRMVPGLVVGEAVPARTGGSFQLYYLFPLTAEQQTIALVQRTVLLVGIVLVALVLAIALLVTRQVVRPVRVAAETASELAGGDLSKRIAARGRDDIARLGQSFNDMADSLQRQIRRLEELSRLQRRFTSDVSHELRTPLTTIRMASELLHGNRDDFPPELARSAELLRDEVDRFESLLGDLLEISRYDAGAAHLESEPADIRPVVASAVEATRLVAERQGSEVVVDQPDRPVLVDMDARRVERILRNLLGNALDHGEGKPVCITVAYDADAVAIAVRDHGVGLRPGEAGLVFNRFWRGDVSRSRLTGGTGLGLAIALEDARLHDGWLQAWGESGKGAQFRLTLPRRAGHTLLHSPLPLDPNDVDEEDDA
jgi:two-component system sensor histidine kinase MtrB